MICDLGKHASFNSTWGSYHGYGIVYAVFYQWLGAFYYLVCYRHSDSTGAVQTMWIPTRGTALAVAVVSTLHPQYDVHQSAAC